jgi:hypothetical protein
MNKHSFNLIKGSKLSAIARSKGYRVFETSGKYDLNIWGIRSSCQIAGEFDDVLAVFWKTANDSWEMQKFIVTVDPSDLHLLNPINVFGTAIIKPGQYRGVWQYGFHKGNRDHPALVQRGEITVIRDFNRNNILDSGDIQSYAYFDYKVHRTGTLKRYYDSNGHIIYKEDTGYFGINCHRASKYNILNRIGLHSAGCVVHKDPNLYYKDFIPLVEKQISTLGDGFTFTLITEEDLYLT